MKVSALKAIANAANAQRSTGPKTLAGKSKSSKNARRHGLNIALRTSSEVSEFSKDLTSNPLLRPYADDISTAHTMIQRIQECRLALAYRGYDQIRLTEKRPGFNNSLAPDFCRYAIFATGLAEVIDELITLDDYERRAIAARRRAIRAFDKARKSLNIDWPEPAYFESSIAKELDPAAFALSLEQGEARFKSRRERDMAVQIYPGMMRSDYPDEQSYQREAHQRYYDELEGAAGSEGVGELIAQKIREDIKNEHVMATRKKYLKY